MRDAIRQRRPLDQLHHQRCHAGAVFEAMNLRDVWMIECGQDLGLALKARQPLGISGDRRGQHLDRDGSLQVDVGGLVHLAHPAFADLGDDFEGTNAGAGRKGHSVGQSYAWTGPSPGKFVRIESALACASVPGVRALARRVSALPAS